MDEYMLHKDYHKSIRGEDGEEPIEALGSPPQTDMDSCYYSVHRPTWQTKLPCPAARQVPPGLCSLNQHAKSLCGVQNYQ